VRCFEGRASRLYSGGSGYLGTIGLTVGAGLSFIFPGLGSLLGMALASAASILAPRLGLLAAMATLPLYLQVRPVGPLAVSFSEAVLLASALGTALRWAAGRRAEGGGRRAEESPAGLHATPSAFRLPPSVLRSAFDWPIALFLLSALLSLLVTQYLRLSLRELRSLVLEPLLTYYLVLAWFPGRSAAWALGALLAGAVAVALGGLAGLTLGLWVTETEGVRRAQATYPSPNHLGLFLGRALPWLLALVCLAKTWRGPALVGTLVVAAAVFGTFSIGAWLGSGAAVLVVAWCLGRARLVAKASVGLAAVGLAALVFVRAERVWSHLEPGRGTTFFRLQLWDSSVAMIRDHPLLGVGLDNFLYLYQQRYILPSALAEANLSHPHNLVLHFWLQLGLPGVIAILWLLARAFTMVRRLSAPSADSLSRFLTVGAAGSLTDFVVHGMIDNSYFLPDLAIIFWLTLALLEAGRRRQDTTPRYNCASL
jgi:putative inorganic carbon (HCO3(-)) transporter